MQQGDDTSGKPEDGFWDRVKSAFGSGEAESPPPARPIARKPRKTAFDNAAERKKRLEKAASERRERLALKVGEKVERVIVDKMETRDEAIEKATTGLENLNGLLHGIGRTLTSQDTTSTEKLSAIHEVQRELTLQRAQRERVVESLGRIAEKLDKSAEQERESRCEERDEAARLERAMGLVVSRLEEQSSRVEVVAREERQRAREEVERVEKALGNVASRIDAGATAERSRAFVAQERLERGLSAVAQRIGEQSEASRDMGREVARSQDESAEAFRDMKRALLATFEETHQRTLETVRELDRARHRELEERTRHASFAGTIRGLVTAGAIGLALFFGLRAPPPAPTPERVVYVTPKPLTPITLPASTRMIVATTVAASITKPVDEIAPVSTSVHVTCPRLASTR
jgi:hypothetical protein